MDISEINKINDRKRACEESKYLREKLSKLSANVIKLNVSQDTAYWDLRQKLQQVEGNHERLQQNMVDVQMQYETISGQYQEELRQRPEILNKLSSTREISDVLEDYCERLRQTLSRCKTDQASLCEAYQTSGQLMQDIKTAHQQNDDRNRQVICNLEEKLKLSEEHQKHLMELFNTSKQQFQRELSTTQEQLRGFQELNEQLRTGQSELNHQLSNANSCLNKKEEIISNLKQEMKKLIQEYKLQFHEAQNTLELQQKNLKQATEANIELKKALAHQEEFSQNISNQNNILEDKLVALEEDKVIAAERIKTLQKGLEESYTANDSIKKEVSLLAQNAENLSIELRKKQDLIGNLNIEIEQLKEQILVMGHNNKNAMEEIEKMMLERNNYDQRIKELVAEKESLQANINENEKAFQNYRDSTTETIENLNKAVEEQKKDLDMKASSALGLISELQTAMDTNNKLQNMLQNCKKELAEEKDNARENEVKMGVRIEHLEVLVKDKENELSKQMTVILEMRNEKDRLQEKISSMQETIDNIQNELTGPPKVRDLSNCAVQPESDDNAVMFRTLDRENSPIMKSSQIATKRQIKKPVPLKESIYSIFSDSSADGNTIDTEEINRRFMALSRGERLPSVPLSTFKRRKPNLLPPPSVPTPASDAQIIQCPSARSSQAKTDSPTKNRMFFKNKRADNKPKKKQ